MPQNTILTQELSLARMILNISVPELVKKSDKNARGCHSFGFCAPD